MRTFAAVFAREIFERRFAFVVAIAAGFVPLIGSLAYGWRSPDAAEGRVLVALVTATALSFAFAVLLGGAVIAGETKEKRISFYFSRPIPSPALWAGKLLSAIFITLATALLAFLPGWLSGTGFARSLWGFDATPGNTALAALVLAVVCVLGSHAVVTVVRLRSPWVVLDLLLAPTVVFLAAFFLRSLVRASDPFFWAGMNPAELALGTLAAFFLVALLLATFFQVAEGRTDARRAHGAFSTLFFGAMGLAVASIAGYAAWCNSATATDIAAVAGGVQVSPRGTWLSVGGPLSAWRGAGGFLYDPASNRSIRARGFNTQFSRDGSRAAWEEPQSDFFGRRRAPDEVFVADLSAGRATATGIEAPGWSSFVVSPTGRRLAVLGDKTLAAYDMADAANPRQLAAFPVIAGGRGIAFVDEDTIRLFPGLYSTPNRKDIPRAGLDVAEFNLPSKTSLVTGSFERETLPWLHLTPDARFLVGKRILTDDAFGPAALTLHDGRSGTLLATLNRTLGTPQVRFLSGDRVVVSGISGGSAHLMFFRGDQDLATPARTIELGPAVRTQIGGEVSPGRIVVALMSPGRRPDGASWVSLWRCVSVDLATGATSPLGERLYPVNTWAWWGTLEPSLPDAGLVPPLFLDADGRLVRLDPATGTQTVLLGKGK